MSALVLVLALQDLARDVREQGVLVFAARSEAGDWDLFAMRPDGSDRRNLTRTPGFHEALPRVSPDGRRLLCRRLPREEAFQATRHGAQGELVVLRSDGTEPAVVGLAGEFPWATWMPDGRRIACLEHRGVAIVEPEGKKALGRVDRKGFYQQLVASPDGRSVVGVTNALDTAYAVARLDLGTGQLQPLSRVDCSTPEWFADGRRLLFSKRPGPWVQVWMADVDGRAAAAVYEETGRHCYGACPSPDGRYAVFTRDAFAGGDRGHVGGTLAVLRLSDKAALLDLGEAWAPQWAEALK